MLMKRVRRGCPSDAAGPAHGFPPKDKRTFDDSNNAEEHARQDETAVQANRNLAALHVRRARDGLVFQVPVAHDGLFPALGRFNLPIKADPSVLPYPPLSLAIAEAA